MSTLKKGLVYAIHFSSIPWWVCLSKFKYLRNIVLKIYQKYYIKYVSGTGIHTYYMKMKANINKDTLSTIYYLAYNLSRIHLTYLY